MKRGYRLLLELDPVDVLLIVSVVEYGVQVRNLLAHRQKNRRQLAQFGELPDGAGVDEPVDEAAASADAMDAGGDHAAAGVPDLVVPGTQYGPARVRVRDNPQA